MPTGINFSGLASGIDTAGIIDKMMQIEMRQLNIPKVKQADAQERLDLYKQLRTKIQNISSAASAVNLPSALNSVKSSSSDEKIAKMTASEAAGIGRYELEVVSLARAQKLSSGAQASASDSLNKTGQITINGKGIEVLASDSLIAVAQKINSARAGVVASIIDGGSNKAYLTLSAEKNGVDHKIQIADTSSSIASDLGLVSGSKSYREPISADTVASYQFSSSTAKFGDMLGLSNLPSASVTINGQSVAVDLNNDSLQNIADRINLTSGIGATASVISEGEGDATKYVLQLKGNNGNQPSIADGGNILETVGILSKDYGNQIVEAQDASFNLDGINFKYNDNSIKDVIPGVTLDLFKSNRDHITKTSYLASTAQTNSNSSSEVLTFGGLLFGGTSYQMNIASNNDLATTINSINTDPNLSSKVFASSDSGRLKIESLGGGPENNFTLVSSLTASNSNSGIGTANQATYVQGQNPDKVTLEIKSDVSSASQKLSSLADAMNGALDYIKSNSLFDKETYQSGPLLGDPIAQQASNEISRILYETPAGVTGKYSNMIQLGFEEKDGKISFNKETFESAFKNDPDSVKALLQSTGKGSSSDITYISSSLGTQEASQGSFGVNITQVATKGVLNAGAAQGANVNAGGETLTFSGPVFGSKNYQLVIGAGSTLDATVAKINNDINLNDSIVAENNSGTLKITSKRYGSGGNFSVVSNLAAATNNSGIGTSGSSPYISGLDIAGTINGEAATGSGQFLMGNAESPSVLLSGVTNTGTNTSPETLTFKGPLFGTNTYTLNINTSDSLNNIVTAINADSNLNAKIVASNDSGKLKIMSKTYGTGSSFTVTSSLAAGPRNSGIGFASSEKYSTVDSNYQQLNPNANNETLTFGGEAFGGNTYNVNIIAGDTVNAIADKINNDANVNGLVKASVSSGKLHLQAQGEGSTGRFTVVSDLAASQNNSGIGTTPLYSSSVSRAGSDSSSKTAGLQIKYAGTSTGNVGSLTFSKGIAARLDNALSNFTSPKSGILTTAEESHRIQFNDLNRSIEEMHERITQKKEFLVRKFAMMESLIAKQQFQSSQMQALLMTNGGMMGLM